MASTVGTMCGQYTTGMLNKKAQVQFIALVSRVQQFKACIQKPGFIYFLVYFYQFVVLIIHTDA